MVSTKDILKSLDTSGALLGNSDKTDRPE